MSLERLLLPRVLRLHQSYLRRCGSQDRKRRRIGTFSVSENKVDDRPTVLLLGWAFSHDYQLAKFSDLHNRLGYDALRHILPSPHFFTYDHARQAADASSLVSQLERLGKTRFIVHTFSNNGYVLYQHVLRAVQKSAKMKVCGAIFDSGPRYLNFRPAWLLGRVMGRSLEEDVRPRVRFLPMVYLLLQVTTEGRRLLDVVPESIQIYKQCKENMKLHGGKFESPGEHATRDTGETFPLLLLHGTKDYYVPVTFLDLVAARQRSFGRDVFSHNFIESGHIEHLKMFPQEYEGRVKAFLEFVEKKYS